MKKLLMLGLFLSAFTIFVAGQTPTPTPDPNPEKTRADRLQARLNDFANFARYRDANTKLTPPAKGEDRVVFMGDSITDGWKLDQYFPGQPYVNRGISGQTTPQMLLR
ncbi:MAG: capsular biosynthesis protein, partial [Acidobacteriota bacterium]